MWPPGGVRGTPHGRVFGSFRLKNPMIIAARCSARDLLSSGAEKLYTSAKKHIHYSDCTVLYSELTAALAHRSPPSRSSTSFVHASTPFMILLRGNVRRRAAPSHTSLPNRGMRPMPSARGRVCVLASHARRHCGGPWRNLQLLRRGLIGDPPVSCALIELGLLDRDKRDALEPAPTR